MGFDFEDIERDWLASCRLALVASVSDGGADQALLVQCRSELAANGRVSRVGRGKAARRWLKTHRDGALVDSSAVLTLLRWTAEMNRGGSL